MPSSKNFNLIIPAAADKPDYRRSLPYIFRIGDDGYMLCLKSIMGLNLTDFDNIYITILRKHAELFDVDSMLSLQLRRLGLENAHIVILDNPTNTQAETIAKTIEMMDVSGSIFIKDADSFFKAVISPANGVAVYPLEKMDIVDPRNKSYVAVDDMQHITNIIEKRVVSNLFNVGGYCFENVEDFIMMYDSVKDLGKIYLSHIIYDMLLSGFTFRPIQVKHYTDWGTTHLYNLQNEN